ncbi:short chain dehydrogenase [Bradyrhizobium yuanmingense]|uniref:Short chain dehydrogenase n=1 Tax=Bradyrhizobium yuanmingense TaxID=108015 RepID=A0A1C3XLV1_9BRAD|nr:SDR family oxidoreductase [Bradyrhizobium sp. NBAIM32]TWI16437.1 short subunit dehydrogenase [Bradyrhizobium yuanmingense]SCB53199.1 short chain dehydrogenase [Bradyrhizobium yuanmingense]
MPKPLALVTGGSSGIGLELALLLAKDGHDLVISGFSDRVQHAASELRSLGAEVIAFSSDLTTAEGNEVVIKVVWDTERPLKIAVLNAGISIGGAFLEIPLERHLDLISLDVISPVRLIYALLPGMIKSGGGKFLFVSSLSATTPTLMRQFTVPRRHSCRPSATACAKNWLARMSGSPSCSREPPQRHSMLRPAWDRQHLLTITGRTIRPL